MNSYEKLLYCFLETRRCQLIYSKCIKDTCSEKERNFYQDLTLNATIQAKKIEDFVKNYL